MTAAVRAAPTRIKQARTRAAEAAQCGGRGRCLTTTIALLHSNADPALQIPCNLIRQWLVCWEQNHRIRPKIGKVWAKNCDSDDGEKSSVCAGTQLSLLFSCNTLGFPFGTQPGKRWSLKAGGVGIHDWGFWQAFRASIEGQLWEKATRHELGTGLEGGADLTTLFIHDSSWRQGACMQPEACCWQRLQRRAGRRSDDIEQGWWNRRFAPDARKRTRTCIIEFGNAEPTQVRSLTRHSISYTKLGIWCQFGNGVLTEACTYIFGDGSGTHSDPRIRRVARAAVIIQGMSNCLGQTLECWKRHSERLMNSLKPTGGWTGTLGEGEPNARQRGIHH